MSQENVEADDRVSFDRTSPATSRSSVCFPALVRRLRGDGKGLERTRDRRRGRARGFRDEL